MIQTKEDLILFLSEDRKALGKNNTRPRIIGDEI